MFNSKGLAVVARSLAQKGATVKRSKNSGSVEMKIDNPEITGSELKQSRDESERK